MTSQHPINSSIIGKRWTHRYYSSQSLNNLWSVEMQPISWSNSIHQSNGSWLHTNKHWICASEVPLPEIKSKVVENEVIDVEGEWNGSNIPSCITGELIKGNQTSGQHSMLCHNYSIMNKIIDVMSIPSSKLKGHNLLTLCYLFFSTLSDCRVQTKSPKWNVFQH